MKRKIAFISEHQSPLGAFGGVDGGGQIVYVAELAKHLSHLGYDIDLYTRWEDPSLPEIIQWNEGVRIIHVKAGPKTYIPKEQLLPSMSEFTDHMLAFMDREDISYRLIHANFFMSGLVASHIKERRQIPYTITFHALGKIRKIHQGEADTFPAERIEIEKTVALHADRVIAECPQDREDLITHYDVPPENIVMIPAGFNPQEFYPIDKLFARNMLKIDPHEKIILQLGRMVRRKGVENVIRATAHLVTEYNVPARLLVVGGESEEPDQKKTPEIGRLLKRARDLGIEHAVTFVGSRGRDQLKYYYNAADVFVTTPWYEPFGITPLESMACGTPVIGSAVGGIQYSVHDGKTGYLVPPEDPDALAHKLKRVLTHPRLLEYLGKNAISRANNLFTWSKIAHSVAQLYEEILSTGENTIEDSLSLISRGFEQAIETYRLSKDLLQIPILDTARTITQALMAGNKILIAGNGGSAGDAQHFAAELVGRFQVEGRKALPALALTADQTILTAWANDYSFDEVFARQIEAYGKPGDIFFGISTSGNSENINRAFMQANERDLITIALVGKNGGVARELADISIVVPSLDTTRIQEVHINIIHSICEIIEKHTVAQEYEERKARFTDLHRFSTQRGISAKN